MKTDREEILMTSLRLFAEQGFKAVSTGMIAGELGITKGALYRHFENKQAIYDAIIQRMFELDAQRAEEDNVPAETLEEDPESYQKTGLEDLCGFACGQFDFWTEDPFASLFRRMITLEQFVSPEATKLYQDVIGMGPVRYSQDLLAAMIENGQLNAAAKAFGAENLAVQLFAPLKLMIELADGGADKNTLRTILRDLMLEYEARWMNKERK